MGSCTSCTKNAASFEYKFYVDCWAKGISDEKTEDTIHLLAYDSTNTLIGKTELDAYGHPLCAYDDDEIAEFEVDAYKEAAYVVALTSGTDAFALDFFLFSVDQKYPNCDCKFKRPKLYDDCCDCCSGSTKAGDVWGVNGGMAYCLSRDPTNYDDKTSVVEECDSCLKFVPNEGAYGYYDSSSSCQKWQSEAGISNLVGEKFLQNVNEEEHVFMNLDSQYELN